MKAMRNILKVLVGLNVIPTFLTLVVFTVSTLTNSTPTNSFVDFYLLALVVSTMVTGFVFGLIYVVVEKL